MDAAGPRRRVARVGDGDGRRRCSGALAAVFVLAACTNGANDRDDARPSGSGGARRDTIALVGTMSGAGTWRGRPARRGVKIALHALRAEAVRMDVRVLDDRGDYRRSTRLVQRAATARDVAGVVFAGPPRALPRAEDALADAGVPAFLCYGDLATLRLLTPHVFQIGPSFRWEAEELTRYAARVGGTDALGALTEDSVMGDSARTALRGALRRHGAELAAARVFQPGRLELLGAHLRRLRAAGVDQIFVEASPPEFARIVATLQREERWEPRLLGFDLTLSPRLGGPAAPPGTVAADARDRGAHLMPEARFRKFRRAAQEVIGRLPVHWEYRAYLAARLVASGGLSRDVADRARMLRAGGRHLADLGPGDSLVLERSEIGLWRAHRSSAASRRDLPPRLPWAPVPGAFGAD